MKNLSEDYHPENPTYVKAFLTLDVNAIGYMENGSEFPIIIAAGPITLAYKTDFKRQIVGPWNP